MSRERRSAQEGSVQPARPIPTDPRSAESAGTAGRNHHHVESGAGGGVAGGDRSSASLLSEPPHADSSRAT